MVRSSQETAGREGAASASPSPPAPAGKAGRGGRRALLAALLLAPLAAAVLYSGHVALLLRREMRPARLPVRAVLGESELSGFREVSFRTRDSTDLSGWWLPPRNGAAVILVHGLGATREQMLPQARMLRSAGFGILLFDLRAHGRSGGSVSTFGDGERLDVRAAVDFASADPGVAPGRLGALGFSLGALAVAAESAEDERVGALALEAGYGTMEELLRHKYGRAGAFSELPALAAARGFGLRVGEVRPLDRLGSLPPRPVLLVYGERDRVTPPAVGREFLAALGGQAELWVVPGGAHGGWERLAPDELESRLVRFFKAALLR
ncbi:MAG TPA: alpha/beta hydrolase [Anaeromyxobacteraceae bacterium]|nr:alpha/beta hydrolase [Anaeromyxobacteraceae bacterium]